MTEPLTDEPLMDAHDVQARIKMGRRFVYGALADGSLPSYKLGGARRVSEDQLQQFLAARATPGYQRSDSGDTPKAAQK